MQTDHTIIHKVSAAIVAIVAGVALTACTAATTTTTGTATSTGTSTSAAALFADNVDSHADSNDVDYDASDAITITLADGASATTSSDGVSIEGDTVTITAPGTYLLSGTLSDGQVVVNSPDDGTVKLVLDDASITSGAGSALTVSEADEVVVILADGSSNSLVDGTGYDTSADDAPNAALFSMADLTIGGSGELSVTGNTNDGIASKDGLVILSGTITVTAADDGIRGKDYLIVAGGTVSVTATGDGLKSDNEEDDTVGYIQITGGTVEVSAGDDGMHAEGDLSVEGGTVTITTSNEGLEGANLLVSGGEIAVTSSDDGLNATQGSTTDSGQGGGGGGMSVDGSLLSISGGSLTVDAEGDGLDSNGTIEISGGTTVVHGPTNNGNGALDSNGGITVSGGTLLAGGSAGMAETPGTDSATGWVAVTFSSQVSAGQTVTIVKDGQTIVTYTATKTIGSLVVADSSITTGESYEVQVDGGAVSTVTAGEGASNGMGGGQAGGPDGRG